MTDPKDNKQKEKKLFDLKKEFQKLGKSIGEGIENIKDGIETSVKKIDDHFKEKKKENWESRPDVQLRNQTRKDKKTIINYVKKVDEHVGKVDEHVEKVDEHVDKVDEHVGKVNEHVDKVDEHIGKVDERVEKVDEHLNDIDVEIEDIKGLISKLQDENAKIFQRILDFEGQLRSFIEKKLKSYYNEKWWEEGIPNFQKDQVEKRSRSKPNENPVNFLTYGDYKSIILNEINWSKIFNQIFREKPVVKDPLENIRKVRNELAHGNELENKNINVENDIEKLNKFLYL